MIRFLGDNGFTAYVYAAKDDAHIRSRWRDVYPGGYLEKLRELIAAASQSSVDFVFTLSPGLNLCYSSAGDRQILWDRLRSVVGLGCDWVGVLLDDIPTKLARARDRKAFSSLGEAHVALLNSTLDELEKSGNIRLLCCPTYYANEYLGEKASENKYLEQIGEGLDPRIDVFWSGRHVVSVRIAEEDVREFEEVIERKPLLWDNYPVNDYYRTGAKWDRPRLNMGPFMGREPDIIRHLAGYFSNPMNEPEASKIPLLTLSDYLDDPFGYSPEQSFERVVGRFLSNEKSRQEIRLMIECSKANPLDSGEVQGLADLVRRWSAGEDGSAGKELSKELESRLEVYFGLRRKLTNVENRKFLSEFEPVLDKVHVLAGLGLSCLRLAQQRRSGSLSKKEARMLETRIRKEMKQVRVNRTQALGEVAFVLRRRAHGEADKCSASELGLPLAERESPVIELYNRMMRKVVVKAAM